MGSRVNDPPPKLRRHHFLENFNTKTFTPQEYQVELLDSVRKQNTISCLGPSTSTTFIAVMAVKELAHQVRIPYSKGGKRSVFVVSTAYHAYQHKKVLEDYTDLRIEKFIGSDLASWTKEMWESEIKRIHILIVTTDMFKTILTKEWLPLCKINLVVFDECHRALRDSIYGEIMRYFDVCNISDQPRILGLCVRLINGKCQPSRLEQTIRNLEKAIRCTVQTASDLTVLSKYGSKPKEYIVTYSQFIDDSAHFKTLLKYMSSVLMFLDDIAFDLKEDELVLPDPCKWPRQYLLEICHVLLTLGPWCAQKAAELFMEEISKIIERLWCQHHKNMLLLVQTSLHLVYTLCENLLEGKNPAEKLLIFASNKLKKLAHILIKFKPPPPEISENEGEEKVTKDASEFTVLPNNICEKNEPLKDSSRDSKFEQRSNLRPESRHYIEDSKALCGVIVVRWRITAYILNQWLLELGKYNEDFKFVLPNYIAGYSKSQTATHKENTAAFRRQEEVLQKFRTRECNILIGTSVVEEGIDIPKCNLIVRFDVPRDFREYVQSKGRSRTDSLYVVMISNSRKDEFVEDLCDFKTVDEVLLKKCHERDQTDEEEVSSNIADQWIQPYVASKEENAPKVSMSSSITLVNRYCAKLPSDTFTRLTPFWEVKSKLTESGNDINYQCTISLPINSPLKKPISGDLMPNIQLAKMSAALTTCKELHKAGELDDNFLPTGKEAVKFEEDFLQEFEKEITPLGTARPGTTKRRQYYYKQVAEALKCSRPQPDKICHLYVFDMKLTCPIPEEQNTRGRKIHDPSDTPRNFGVITSVTVPPICSFPVFTRSGEVTVSLDYLTSLYFTKDQLEELSYFHKYTFADVLRLEKYPMLFDPEEAECSFYVVPIDKRPDDGSLTIDWDFVSVINLQKGVLPRKISDDERKNFTFEVDKYLDAVVMPWYRNLDKPQFFYVAEICNSLNPMSNFPDTGYETFEGYYKKKYNITIMNTNQPLLDVDHTSARLNLLTPRYVNRKGVTLPTSSEQTKRAKRENLQQKQILIPELCVIHPFPASLWRKAVCLPCIFYRVNSLLLGEQLRLTVAKEISVGLVGLPKDFLWPILDFGWTLADVLKAQTSTKEEENATQSVIPQRKIQDNSVQNEIEENASFPQIDTWSNEMAANNNFMNSFDPNKMIFSEDDDFLADQEINSINFGDGNFITTTPSNFPPLWSTPPKSDDNENAIVPVIRYGSPSAFEDSGWDSEWDTDVEDGNNFFSINVPGLGYISAPGVFNVQGLSLDLASRGDDDDIWDSMDDDDSVCDEVEMNESYKNSKSPDNGLSMSHSSMHQESVDDVYKSIWLSNFSSGDKDATNVENTDEDVIERMVELQISNKRQKKKNEIQILETGEQSSFRDYEKDSIANEELFFQKLQFSKVLSAVKDIEKIKEDKTKDEEPIIEALKYIETEKETSDISNNHTETSVKEEIESTLAFGELLPDRESFKFNDNEIFRVHFDECTDLINHPGPSPSIILQAFTMSNANDGINLERLETVGDSFLKYAITAYLFCTYPDIHEGKLSYLRSKQISNLNLYRLGKKKHLGELMVATKFEPNDNWLPPCYIVPKGLEQALIESGMPVGHWNIGNLSDLTQMNEEQIRQTVMEKNKTNQEINISTITSQSTDLDAPYIPYNLLTQHSIPDKSIADCVEALIGSYLVSCGPRGALLFMSWLGLRVLPSIQIKKDSALDSQSGKFGFLKPPKSPLLTHVPNAQLKLDKHLSGYAAFEQKIGYSFNDKAYLLQAFTHASYHYNRLTDCYQRLEFLGDAVLDYLITRHLYEDPQKHSPGTLTDLRSALVNNTFFASLAVKYDFHKYFKAISPGLFNVINKFVDLKKKRSPGFEDYVQEYYLEEEECEEAEEVEVPKALGDIFESVAGAIYLDSGMSLDTVWRVYYAMMKPEIEYFSTHVPKSPIRELLEMEPQTTKFERAEMTLSGKVRVRVEVFGKGQFIGVGRNKRIAKCTAAKRALRELKKMKQGTVKKF